MTDAAGQRSEGGGQFAVPPGLPEKYTIVRVLGEGGMGTVFEARDRVLDRRVALKVLSERASQDPAFVDRFLGEARTVAQLNDPAIVQVYDFGPAGGRHFLAMEFVDGRSLAADLAASVRFGERETIAIARQACVALSVAHAAGVVHRDVKPDNMMRTSRGQFKLVDLGLAKRVDEERSKTGTGVAMGTPYYISPEQIRGDPTIDGRTDIYSLGAAIYQLATGRIPFEGTSGPHVMSRHLHDPLPDPRTHVPELSAGFCRVIARMMAKDAAERYQTTAELDADLAALELGRTPPRASELMRRTPASVSVRAWAPGELAAVESALAACVGPLAHVLVAHASRAATSREELCRTLSAQIEAPASRAAFLAACGVSAATPPSGSPRHTSVPTPTLGVAVSATAGGTAAIREGRAWDADRTASLTALLAAHVGPVARVLVRRATARTTDVAAVVAELAAHIDRPAARDAFTASALQLR